MRASEWQCAWRVANGCANAVLFWEVSAAPALDFSEYAR